MKKILLIIAGAICLLLCLGFVLFPIFTTVPEKARGAKCTRNVRQLKLAIPIYQPVPRVIPALPTTQGFTADKFPGIDGSTSTQPLTDLLIASMLGLKAELKKNSSSNDVLSGVYVELHGRVADEKRSCYQDLSDTSRHNGTHDAYVALLTPPPHTKQDTSSPPHSSDLILVARKPSVDELHLAKSHGIGMEIHPIALDAFVFLVNANNPVHSLTLDQIRTIYSGKVRDWNALGGNKGSIEAYKRDPNSGSEELMQELVMGTVKTMPLEVDWKVLDTMEAPINAIAEEPNGIAYSVYYYEHFLNHRRENRLLAINGILPTKETIASRKYPLTTEVYIVTRKNHDPKAPAVKVRDWLLSTAGQEMVRQSGYIPIKPKH